MFYYMHNNNNNYYYQCKMCWNKALTFGVGSIKLSFRAIVFTQYMHAKMFSIQMLLQYGSQKSSHFLLIEKRYFTNTQCVKNGMVRLNGKLNGVN